MSGFTQRALTAVVFVVVMLGGLFGGKYSFSLLFLLITALCLWEFWSLCLDAEEGNKNGWSQIFGLFLGLLPISLVAIERVSLLPQAEILLQKGFLLLPALFFLLFVYELTQGAVKPFRNLAYLALGLLYISLPFALLVYLAIDGNGHYSPLLVLGMLLLTWANDTGAYLVGSKLGKTPLFPRISPNKTWEGSMGGVFIGLLVGWGLSFIVPTYSTFEWLVIALIIVIFGSLGDLVESMLKRSLKIKDSGHFLPGHGGFLDRFDAFIFVIPFVAAFLLCFR
ncbi:MAG: phosphatidate cytidylyltransferase [Bacteroidota bacterium]